MHVNRETGVRAGVWLNRSDYNLMTLALALAASRTHAGNSSSTLALPVSAAVLSWFVAVAATANWTLFHCDSKQSSNAVKCVVQPCSPACAHVSCCCVMKQAYVVLFVNGALP